MKGNRRYLLAILSFLGQFSIAMANFALVYFLRFKGFDSFEIGFSASLNPLFYFIACFVFHLVLKDRKPKLEVMISTFGMALSLICVLFTPSKMLTYVFLSLYGIFNSLLWPNVETWITQHLEGKELGSAVALFNFSWSFGAGISTLVGGVLSAISVQLPIIIVVAILLLLSILASSIEKPDEEGKEDATIGIIKVDRSTYLRYFCWIGIILLYIGYSLIITIFPLYALEVLDISEERTGLLLLARGISACLSFVMIGRMSFWQFRASFVMMMQLAFIVLVSLLAFIQSEIWFAIVFVLFGFVFAAIYELSIFHGASGSINREKRMMIHEVLLTLGTIIGSLSGGYVYKYFSFQIIVAIIAASSFVVWCLEMPFMVKASKINRSV